MKKQSETEIRRSLASSIAIERRKRNWTQQELASRSGVPRSYIADLEGARRNPSIATLVRIANGLGVQFNELFRPKQDKAEY